MFVDIKKMTQIMNSVIPSIRSVYLQEMNWSIVHKIYIDLQLAYYFYIISAVQE